MWISLGFIRYKFARYRFVRYRFIFVRYIYLQSTFCLSARCLQVMSSRRLQDIQSRRFQDMFSRRLQEIFSVTICYLPRRPEDVLRDFLKENKKLLCWKHVEDIFKTCLEDQKVSFSKTLYPISLPLPIKTSHEFVITQREWNNYELWQRYISTLYFICIPIMKISRRMG